MIRKIALQAGVAALFVLILWNGYVVVTNVKGMRKIGALTAQSAGIQAEISSVVTDLTDMEMGQRGYLLTDDPSHLQTYRAAKDRIAADFEKLRAGLANRSEREQGLEAGVESAVNGKLSDIEHSITLREQGYRHRAFKLVAANDGMSYMEKARQDLSSLTAAEAGRLAKIEADRNAGLAKVSRATVLIDLGLLVLVAGLFVIVRYHGRVLEQEAAQSAQQLASHDFQLAKLTSALSNEARSKTFAIEANARLLLHEYGGFLPRHAHQCAEQIEEASIELEQLRQGLVADSGSADAETAACEAVA
jgi:CHASE3 domain sensor protein